MGIVKFNLIAALAALLHLPKTIADVEALLSTLRSRVSTDALQSELAAAPGVTDLVAQVEAALAKVVGDAQALRKSNLWNIGGRFAKFVADSDVLFEDVRHADPAQLLEELKNTPEAASLINDVTNDWAAIRADFAGLLNVL